MFLKWDLYSPLLRVNAGNSKLKQVLAGKESIDKMLVRKHSGLTSCICNLEKDFRPPGCTAVIILLTTHLLSQINALYDALNTIINERNANAALLQDKMQHLFPKRIANVITICMLSEIQANMPFEQ